MKLTIKNPTKHEIRYFGTLIKETEALVDSVLYGEHMDPLISPLRRAIIVIDILLLLIARTIIIITQKFPKIRPHYTQASGLAGIIKKSLRQIVDE